MFDPRPWLLYDWKHQTSSIVPLQVDDESLPLKSRCRVNKGRPKHTFCEESMRRKNSILTADQTTQTHIKQNTNVQHIRRKAFATLHRSPSISQKIASKLRNPNRQMPALFTRDTNTPTTMSGANPFQSLDSAAKATGQENQMQEAQQHKQVLEKKAAVDTKYVSLAGRWSREEEMSAQ
jgi:hypothetical protein